MLTLNDGRNELWQWDTKRKLTVDAECSQVHFSNKVFGRSIDVDVVGGMAEIPDILLQTDKELTAWAFVGTPENGYTKISKAFKVNRRNKPADYVFTPPDQTTLEQIKERIEHLESIQDPDAIKNAVEDYLEQNPVEAPVQSVNGQTGEVKLIAYDVGAISQDDLQKATNEALAQAKASGEFDGADGTPGKDGISATHRWNGTTLTVTSASGTSSADLKGEQGPKGDPGESYTLPIASSTQLGGVQPAAKTDTMTQAVGVDADGALWTAPWSTCAGGTETWRTVVDLEISEDDVARIDISVDGDGKPFSLKKFIVLFPNKWTAATAGYFKFNDTPVWIASLFQNSGYRMTKIIGDFSSGQLMFTAVYSTNTASSAAQIFASTNPNGQTAYNQIEGTALTSLSIYPQGTNTLVAGTKLKLIGVDAM